MGRRRLLGIALVMGIVTPSAWPEAASAKPGAPRTTRTEPAFTSGWVNGEPTLRAEARGVRFSKQVSRERMSIRVEVPGDRIEVEADTKGTVRIGKFLRLQMQDRFEANVARIQKLTAGSAALDGHDPRGGPIYVLGRIRDEHESIPGRVQFLHRGLPVDPRLERRVRFPVLTAGRTGVLLVDRGGAA